MLLSFNSCLAELADQIVGWKMHNFLIKKINYYSKAKIYKEMVKYEVFNKYVLHLF